VVSDDLDAAAVNLGSDNVTRNTADTRTCRRRSVKPIFILFHSELRYVVVKEQNAASHVHV
jgi:hypothetical protein